MRQPPFVREQKGETMRTADFYYDLPEELIAQDPLLDILLTI